MNLKYNKFPCDISNPLHLHNSETACYNDRRKEKIQDVVPKYREVQDMVFHKK